MKIVIIDGHPDPDRARLIHALADEYAAGAEESCHEVRRLDVAARALAQPGEHVGFQPLQTSESDRISDDVNQVKLHFLSIIDNLIRAANAYFLSSDASSFFSIEIPMTSSKKFAHE